MISANIKNLSIALEALTRVQGVEDEFAAVRQLLDKEIDKAQKEQHPAQTYTHTDLDDEIPF